MIAVVDYKAGNLTSVMKALTFVTGDVLLTDDPNVIRRADRIVLPGVGHFSATCRLDDTGITSVLRMAIARGTPFLGICVGMQWLLQGSEEAPGQPGLGHFTGRCERFPEGLEKVPHVGWNTISTRTGPTVSRLFEGVEQQAMVYFTHSYFVPMHTMFVDPADRVHTVPVQAAATHYLQTFASAVEHENVMGVQFHPEKSGAVGLQVLENFVRFRC